MRAKENPRPFRGGGVRCGLYFRTHASERTRARADSSPSHPNTSQTEGTRRARWFRLLRTVSPSSSMSQRPKTMGEGSPANCTKKRPAPRSARESRSHSARLHGTPAKVAARRRVSDSSTVEGPMMPLCQSQARPLQIGKGWQFRTLHALPVAMRAQKTEPAGSPSRDREATAARYALPSPSPGAALRGADHPPSTHDDHATPSGLTRQAAASSAPERGATE